MDGRASERHRILHSHDTLSLFLLQKDQKAPLQRNVALDSFASAVPRLWLTPRLRDERRVDYTVFTTIASILYTYARCRNS